MKLSDKLDKLISQKQLTPTIPKIIITLQEALNNINDSEPDEDGIIKTYCDTIDLKEEVLPIIFGKFIVDDIQKRSDGTYEVHCKKAVQK